MHVGILRRQQKHDETSKPFFDATQLSYATKKLISIKIWRFHQILGAFSEYMNFTI